MPFVCFDMFTGLYLHYPKRTACSIRDIARFRNLTLCNWLSFLQATRTTSPDLPQEEINDLRLPTHNRTPRSSLNAMTMSPADPKVNNSPNVTTAIVNMPAQSADSELDPIVVPSPGPAGQSQNPNVVRISTL